MPNKFNISIVGQNEIEGEGLRRILVDASLNVAGVFGTVESVEIPEKNEAALPFFIVHSPTDDTSIEMCRALRQKFPSAPVVMMGHNCDNLIVATAFRVGIDGFISKNASCACFVQMIQLVALGEKVVPSQVILDLATFEDQIRWSETEARVEEANISDREIEILQGLIHGDPNKIISRRLNITEATVKVHVKSILRKLHVANRTQAAVWALSRGIGTDRRPAVEPKAKPQLSIVNGHRRSMMALGTVAASAMMFVGDARAFF